MYDKAVYDAFDLEIDVRNLESMPLTLGVNGDPRIIDVMDRADKSKRIRIRHPQEIDALVLHQMQCCYELPNPLWGMPVHFAILPDGKIFQLHPIQAFLESSNGFNRRSVAVEFAGNFPDVNGKWLVHEKFIENRRQTMRAKGVPETKIQAWVQKFIDDNKNQVTPQQIEAGRYLVRYLMRALQPARGLTHIFAHRQASSKRENCPGPDIWYHVGQWAVENLRLKDGGSEYRIGKGNPIPNAWRNLGRQPRPARQPEVPSQTNRKSPEYIRWVQQSLNQVLASALVVDGKLGPKTRSDIRTFQQRAGLQPDGIMGSKTEVALRAAGAPPPPSVTAPSPAPATPPDIVSVRGIQVARQIAAQVESLLTAATRDGIQLSGWGYRSTARQIDLRRKHCGPTHYDIWEKPSNQCTRPTARPGRSMHEKGLAIDFTYNGKTIPSHTNPGFQWLKRNASRFGLYNLPSEPWHWSVNGN